jgi:hypothetical protein
LAELPLSEFAFDEPPVVLVVEPLPSPLPPFPVRAPPFDVAEVPLELVLDAPELPELPVAPAPLPPPLLPSALYPRVRALAGSAAEFPCAALSQALRKIAA